MEEKSTELPVVVPSEPGIGNRHDSMLIYLYVKYTLSFCCNCRKEVVRKRLEYLARQVTALYEPLVCESSTVAHSYGKIGGPPSKPKYDLLTDSEQVP